LCVCSICPDGQIAAVCFAPLSIAYRKNILLYPTGKSSLQAGPSRAHQEGRIAIVTNVGRGMRWTLCMRKTSAGEADGEAVWF
jgi:hypothetical protein